MAKKKKLNTAARPKEEVATVTPSAPNVYVVAGILILVLTLACSFLLYKVVTDEGGSEKVSQTSKSTDEAQEEFTPPAKTSRPSGDAAAHRKQLVDNASKLIEQARELARRPNFSEMMVAISKGDYTSLPANFKNKFRMEDQLKADPELKSSAYISVLQLGQIINQSVPEGRKMEALHEEAWKFVFVDAEAGNAFVPLSLYLGPKAAFSFEYVWVNGGWIFSPFSFIDSVSSADIAASDAAAGATE